MSWVIASMIYVLIGTFFAGNWAAHADKKQLGAFEKYVGHALAIIGWPLIIVFLFRPRSKR